MKYIQLKKIESLIFFGIFFLLIITFSSYAQTEQQLANIDLKTVNVDNLSDEQIRRFMQEAQTRGLTQQEIEIALSAKGMPASEIEKLKNRIFTLQSSTTTTTPGGTGTGLREKVQPESMFQSLTEAQAPVRVVGKPKIFGMDLFQSKYLTFEPSLNIPTPQNYQIGPGDQIVIDIWGASEQTYQLVVSSDGYIKIPNIGPIFVNGLSMDLASSRIISRLTKIYSGLIPENGVNPNTYAQVSLGQIRSIKISVIGEVMNPGTYTVSALATVFNALYLAGGPNESGSLRKIEVLRNGKIETELDVYDFLTKGLHNENKRLQDQDIVRVIPYLKRVEIAGEVKKPGIYEIREGENFNQLLNFCGGFTEKAYQATIKIKRNTSQERKIEDFKLDSLLISSPENGDYIFVEPILNRYTNRVQISGAVFRPGEFELKDGLTVKKIIEKANGLRGDAFLERSSIYRTREDFSTEVIPFNLRNLITGKAEDIPLQREDLVRISSIYDLDEEFYVTIQGEVRLPGVYPFMLDMSIQDLIFVAGGMRESASEANVEVSRRIITDSTGKASKVAQIFTFNVDKDLKIIQEDKKAFTLNPFDNVFIRKSPFYEIQRNVKVEGEIKYPGSYSIEKKSERISDILKRAGGITANAYIKGATLIRRTEFYPPNSDYEQKLVDIRKLKNTTNLLYRDREIGELNESELSRKQRLDDFSKIASQYQDNESIETGQQGIRIRQQRLAQLAKRDTLVGTVTNPRFEAIGINLGIIINNPGSKYDLIIQDGDIISIPKQLETVRLRGELLYPTSVRYDGTASFRKYISQAGGFTANAKQKKTYIVYANGSVNRTRRIIFINIYPKVEPGADIIVPSKPPKQEGMGVAGWIAFSTSIATLALVIKSLVP